VIRGESKQKSAEAAKAAILARLRSNDRQKLANDIAKTKEECLSPKKKLGFQIGHPVEDTRVFQKENNLKAVDS
jgi:hypothetical protein